MAIPRHTNYPVLLAQLNNQLLAACAEDTWDHNVLCASLKPPLRRSGVPQACLAVTIRNAVQSFVGSSLPHTQLGALRSCGDR